jgi:transcription initiation factor TFIIIB Brf1 subunit/transcription initiation factor TFIIB
MFSNPLASLDQLQTATPSQQHGFTRDLEYDYLHCGCRLIQSAGVLLHLPQITLATAQILLHRTYRMTSLIDTGILETALGSLLLSCKLAETPRTLTDIINVFDYVVNAYRQRDTSPLEEYGTLYYDLKNAMLDTEMTILVKLNFLVHVELPYVYLVNYMQMFGLEQKVIQRAWNYLNDALCTPVYVLFEIHTIACGAIYLVTSEQDIPLPQDWWSVFDTDKESVECVAGWMCWIKGQQVKQGLCMWAKEMRQAMGK